ncbi:hypothetical protein [Alkaliphilus serpentinus]|uniref:Uncharacterized protein n=1 Tax=Alkaliphilus serpentinus TaxID=1482731 RepID=A0A833HP78_9FIRM|nr:hypothetical protein [Alkaliphilus serpentinus]KAB3530505.1 hypothetical protein F8153_06540 [Alkaliphilus serpentinus]
MDKRIKDKDKGNEILKDAIISEIRDQLVDEAIEKEKTISVDIEKLKLDNKVEEGSDGDSKPLEEEITDEEKEIAEKENAKKIKLIEEDLNHKKIKEIKDVDELEINL